MPQGVLWRKHTGVCEMTVKRTSSGLHDRQSRECNPVTPVKVVGSLGPTDSKVDGRRKRGSKVNVWVKKGV